MDLRQVGCGAMRLSRIALGGHEYLPSGHSRGFNEDFAKAITPRHSFPGFGGVKRKAVLAAAYDLGVNFFDVTLDAEKEALGRNLAEMPPPYAVYIQTRPEAMNYSYDPGNRKMTDLTTLRAEVQRILKLLRRDRLDVLNLGPLRGALESDPDFVSKVAANVRDLQREGLILCAAADTFSGQGTYESLVKSGAFATLNVNFNVADDEPARTLFPLAHEQRVHVTVREALIKGALFGFGRELELDDGLLARAALKWMGARSDIDTVIVGADTAQQFRDNVAALEQPILDDAEKAALERLLAHPPFAALKAHKRAEFLAGSAIGQRAAL